MLACGFQHSLFIGEDGVVWGSGDNSLCQLGQGRKKNLTRFLPVPDLPPIIQLSVSTNASCSLFLDNEGAVWRSGTNDGAQFLLETDPQPNIKPFKIPNLPCIVAIACGYNFSLVLDNTGSIWGAGSNRYSQLSMAQKNISNFTLIDTSHVGKIIKIACGQEQSIVQNELGELWGTGNNQSGLLGTGQYEDVISRYQMISAEFDKSALDFSLGVLHSVVLDTNGKLWSAGNNFSGNLGLGDGNSRSVFTPIPNIPVMVSLIVGSFSSMSIDRDGVVYAWGCNEQHLGFGRYNENILSPNKIPNLPKITQGAIGSYHSLLVDEGGSLWVSGSNYLGQLGLGNMKTKGTFIKVRRAIVVSNNNRKRFYNTKRANV